MVKDFMITHLVLYEDKHYILLDDVMKREKRIIINSYLAGINEDKDLTDKEKLEKALEYYDRNK